MTLKSHTFSALVFLAASIGFGHPTTATAQEIGKVASITPQMRGQAPGAATRTLRAGSSVVSNQRIVTGANGRGQLLFLDETTLSVASRSEIVLDRFIYDPNRGAGEIGLSLTRGALRFIGGKATNRQPARIDTPTGTISIRGSSALVLIQNGRTYVVFVAGEQLCFVVLNGKRYCTNRRGAMLGDDGYLGKISSKNLANLLARIDGPARSIRANGRAGTGIDGQNPSNRPPLSTTGETYDNDAPNSTFGTDTTEGLLRDDDGMVEPNMEPVDEPFDEGDGGEGDDGGGGEDEPIGEGDLDVI